MWVINKNRGLTEWILKEADIEDTINTGKYTHKPKRNEIDKIIRREVKEF